MPTKIDLVGSVILNVNAGDESTDDITSYELGNGKQQHLMPTESTAPMEISSTAPMKTENYPPEYEANIIQHTKKPSQVNNLVSFLAKHIEEKAKALETLAPISEDLPKEKEDKSRGNSLDDDDFMEFFDQNRLQLICTKKWPARWQTMVSLRSQQASSNKKMNDDAGSDSSQEKSGIYSGQDDCDTVQILDVSFRTFSVSDTGSRQSSKTFSIDDVLTIHTLSSKSLKSRKSMDLSSACTSSLAESVSINSDCSRNSSTSSEVYELQELSNEMPSSEPIKTSTPQVLRESPKSVFDLNCEDTNSHDVVDKSERCVTQGLNAHVASLAMAELFNNDDSHLLRQLPRRAPKGKRKFGLVPTINPVIELSRNDDSFRRQPDKVICSKKGKTNGRVLDPSCTESTQSTTSALDDTVHRRNGGEFEIAESAVRPADIKMGQSPTFREHSGNKLLRDLVCQNYNQYYAGSKHEKTQIAEDIMNHICDRGGRFLKRPTNKRLWVVVKDVLEVRDKVASSFRSEKKRRSEKRRGKIIPDGLPKGDALGDPLGLPGGDALELPVA